MYYSTVIHYKGGEKLLKKYLRIFGLVGALTFLIYFVYFYKTSGKFRQSIMTAFGVATVFFSSQQLAHSAGQADAFTQQNPQHQSRPQKGRGTFGSGPGKPNGNDSNGDDGGIPKSPKTESIEETKRHLSYMDKGIQELEEVTDSDSETECQLESKAGFTELPNGKTFLYDMEQGRGLIKQAKRVLKNPEARKEVLRILDRFDNKTVQEKPLKGFKSLTELKNSGPRIIVHRDKNKRPTVIAICMRKDLDPTLAKLKGKYI